MQGPVTSVRAATARERGLVPLPGGRGSDDTRRTVKEGHPMFSRRDFLRTSSLVALAPTVPAFLAQTAQAAAPARDSRVLVVVQLDGGNDGINTVVPFRDE